MRERRRRAHASRALVRCSQRAWGTNHSLTINGGRVNIPALNDTEAPMNRVVRWQRLAAIAAALTMAVPAWAAAAEEAEESAPSEAWLAGRAAEKTEALAALKRMSDFLGKQKKLSFEAEIGYDAVQASGHKLEFGGSREVTIRRPDRLRVEGRARHGEEKTLIFDGKRISVIFADENAYAQVEKPGTIDEAIDYLVDDLGTPAPLADLYSNDFYAEVVDKIEWGVVLGDVIVEGVRCQHLAFLGTNVDAQFWVASGDQPLPIRIVITYPEAEGEPQFWARLHGWNLSAKASDGLFAFTPAKDAERIPFAPRNLAELQGEAQR